MNSAAYLTRVLSRTVALLLAGGLGACASDGGGSIYYHPNADLSLYQRVAVLPLENFTTDRFAAERVREILVVELSALELFDVAETGEVNRVMRAHNIVGSPAIAEIGPDQIVRLGQELDAQALILGSVMEYRERRTGTINAPDVAISLRLIDVETGIVAWSVSDAHTGVGVWTRLFGVGERTQSKTARELIRKLVETLY